MSRADFNTSRVVGLSSELSDREMEVLETLDRLRLATGEHLEVLHFADSTPRHRRRTLLSMTERRLIRRLDRVIGGRRAGSTGLVFALDVGGAKLLEQSTGVPRRRPTVPGARLVSHCLGVSSLYVGLIQAERRSEIELLDFDAEPQCWRRFPGPGGGTTALKPDAFVRIGVGEFAESWFVEWDLATETAPTLSHKADVYRMHYASGREQHDRGVYPRVLWVVPTEKRYITMTDTLSHQPADYWRLHQVTLASDAVGLIAGGTP